jgi:transposase-like protein
VEYNRVRDIKGVVKRQRRYSTLAKKEGRYAIQEEAKELREHLPEMARDSANEAKIAFSFARKRRGVANKEEKKLHGKEVR